jgi:hypothetical protein
MRPSGVSLAAAALIALSSFNVHADGIKVYTARSGSLPFTASVVTNVVVDGEWGLSPAAVTNVVYTIVTSATNALDVAILDRRYVTTLEPATNYTDTAVSAAVDALDRDIRDRNYLTEHQPLDPAYRYADGAAMSATNSLDQDIRGRHYLTEYAIEEAVSNYVYAAASSVTNNQVLVRFDDPSQTGTVHMGVSKQAVSEISAGAILDGGFYLRGESGVYWQLSVGPDGTLKVTELESRPTIVW